ncbi:hypothetical protein C8D76_105101 [Pasteurella langaaensis DSM 22999]|uniref:Outer membrane protein n=1 Tax=Alitibacter langaaensis DSM 22999 TaxID=1122935 RepID=A0A2U0T831_9PAST|nr:hypothetical protein [Pasteurella langaaensis]PVX39765.1 hypothetical protein C8D76_105101 [Pasteurella langaaensis DSM 22999]
MKNVMKSVSLAIIAAAFASQAMANPFEKRIEANISNEHHQDFNVEANQYQALKTQLNAKLAQLSQAANMNTFNTLAAEAKELAQQTKSAAESETFNYGSHQDTLRAELGVNYANWKLNNLIGSLDAAVATDSVAAAKDMVVSHI